MESHHPFERTLVWVTLLWIAACSPEESSTRPVPVGTGSAGVSAGIPPLQPRPGATAGSGSTLPPIGAAGVTGAAVGGRGAPGTAGLPGTGSAGVGGPMSGNAGTGKSPTTSGAGAAGIRSAAEGGSGSTSSQTAGRGAAGSDGSTAVAGTGGPASDGACCADGSCICRGDVPAELTAKNGPYRTATTPGRRGTVHYPSDAEPPFAALAITPGFLNTGPEMRPWGEFYASWGIVTHVTSAGAGDIPEIRAQLLLDGIDELKTMNMDEGGPIGGKLSGRYGISGYSYGGGGATIGASRTPDLASAVGLAPFGGSGGNSKVPTLVFCGEVDIVAACFMADSVYGGIPDQTPKMYISVPGAEHLSWFGPTVAGGGTSGKYALAFQKVFLEGDPRWKTLLMQKPAAGEYKTNIE